MKTSPRKLEAVGGGWDNNKTGEVIIPPCRDPIKAVGEWALLALLKLVENEQEPR